MFLSFFRVITLEQHSALIKINQLLQSLSDINFTGFKLAFNVNEPLLDLLPGGIRIESALALIESHRTFFF